MQRRFTESAASASDSLEKLKVSQLQQLLDRAGVDYRDCLEKKELVQRIQAARHVLPTEAKQLLDSMLSGDSSKSYSHDDGAVFMEEQHTVRLFQRCAPSVVFITTTQVKRDMSFNVQEIPQGTGSGFFWDDQGYLASALTCFFPPTPHLSRIEHRITSID